MSVAGKRPVMGRGKEDKIVLRIFEFFSQRLDSDFDETVLLWMRFSIFSYQFSLRN